MTTTNMEKIKKGKKEMVKVYPANPNNKHFKKATEVHKALADKLVAKGVASLTPVEGGSKKGKAREV